MKLIDNINNTLGNEIEENLNSKSRLKIAASYFSIYAFAALKKELEKIEESPYTEYFRLYFLNGAKVHSHGDNPELCKVDFINRETGDIEHSGAIKCGEWIETSKKYRS